MESRHPEASHQAYTQFDVDQVWHEAKETWHKYPVRVKYSATHLRRDSL